MGRMPSPEKLNKAHPVMKSLRKIRRGRRITLRALGKIIGWHANSISGWENATTSPTLHSLSAYAEALGLKIILVPKDRYQERHRDD